MVEEKLDGTTIPAMVEVENIARAKHCIKLPRYLHDKIELGEKATVTFKVVNNQKVLVLTFNNQK